MKKPVKYLWLALGGVVALLMAGSVVLALTFDPNRYKDDIERMALERTGRTLKLQGELKLAFFPSLGAAVAGVTLSERGSGREFVSLESVHASIKLMPLIYGGDDVTADGFSIGPPLDRCWPPLALDVVDEAIGAKERGRHFDSFL